MLAEEPPPKDQPLLQLDQVICTPHLGASTGEAQVNVAVAIAQQVADFLTRGSIQTAVNVPSLSPEVLLVLRPYLLLAEKLGALQAQLGTEAPLEVTVQASGEVAERDVRSLTAAAPLPTQLAAQMKALPGAELKGFMAESCVGSESAATRRSPESERTRAKIAADR